MSITSIYDGGGIEKVETGLDKYIRPTVRQELESRKAMLIEQLKFVDDALEALTPEVERLLDALRRVGM